MKETNESLIHEDASMLHDTRGVQDGKKHIVLVIGRGEAIRNFLDSDILVLLQRTMRVTILSVIDSPAFREKYASKCERILPLQKVEEQRFVAFLRKMIHWGHFRWIWTEAAKYHYWGHDGMAKTIRAKTSRMLVKAVARIIANRWALDLATRIERWLSWHLRPVTGLETLFHELQPDLVFNCSHIHALEADYPMMIATQLGYTTAVFVFSWDNLFSRSRIFVDYDHYLMWNTEMKVQLMNQYHALRSENIHVTGTPQFDYHFKKEYVLSREALCEKVGLDKNRPFLLYTTGLDRDFPGEHHFVQAVIEAVETGRFSPQPQLLVRRYIKGISQEVQSLSMKAYTDVIFPEVLWNEEWSMPLEQDYPIYTSLLHHCAAGINVASTVSLELMILRKPVINIGMEPPGVRLDYPTRFGRHVEYEHYRPVVESGGVMVARTMQELLHHIQKGLSDPEAQADAQKRFIDEMFDAQMDGNASRRIVHTLKTLANGQTEKQNVD